MVGPTTIDSEAPAGVSTAPAASPEGQAGAAWRATWALAWREVVRFLRQRNRVVGAVGQPLLFWLLFGTGMNQMFQVPGQRFSVYFVPGTLVLILLFTAIFATISIIEDRQEGFLQAVLVAPVPRWSIVLGKIAGGSVLAVGQGMIFLALSLTLGFSLTLATGISAVGLMCVIAVALTGLGFCIAWRLDSTQGFHAIMNLLLMPMWLLSGAFFPVPQITNDASWGEMALHGIMRLNPVTYAVAGLRYLLSASSGSATNSVASALWMPSLTTCWLVSLTFATATFALAARVAKNPTQGDFR